MRTSFSIPVVILLATVSAAAQVAGNSHVFPQIADGRQTDGLYYVSRFWIMSLGPASNCTLSLHGLDSSRLASPPAITVPSNSWSVIDTRGVDPLAVGYARLDCSQPVTASLTYSLLTPAGTTAGMATVFSAPASSYAMHPLLLAGGVHYGVALANDSDATAVLTLLYTDALSGGSSGRTIEIPPRSQRTGFVDQFVTVPAEGEGTLEIEAVGTGPASFRITGLLFNGSVFTTLVPAVTQ
jgi:hypothetical protein